MTITVDIGGGQIVEFPDVETAQQFMAGQQQPSVAEDVGRGFLGGAISGVGAIMDLPAAIGSIPMRLSDRFLGTDMMQDRPAPTGFVEAVGQVAPSVQAAAQYEPQTVAGDYAQTTGEFLPGLVTPGGPLARLGYGVLAPAIGSETAGRAAEFLGAGETGQAIARFGGAIVSPALAERALRGVVSPMAGTAAPRVQAAETLRQAGVPVSAGQQSGSGLLRRLEDTAAPSEDQLEALTQAALRSIGSNATRATDDVLNEARNRIGGVFDDVTQNLTVDVQPFRAAQLQRAADTYRQLAPTTSQAPIIDDIVAAVSNPNNPPSARQIMTWRSRLSRLTATPDAATRQAAVEALEAVDDIVADSLRNAGRDADVAALGQARSQWRDYLAIERAASQGSATAAEGLLSPAALRMGVQGQSRSQYVRGQRGDLGDITRASQSVLASSPAVMPGGVRVIEGAGRATMAGLGGVVGGLPGAAAGFIAPELLRAGITSAPAQAYLRNQLVGPAVSRLTPTQRALVYGPATGFPSVFNQGQGQ
jgi:hypothetical protein